MMDPVRVVVNGALGKVGRELIQAFASGAEINAVGAVDFVADRESLSLPNGKGSIPLATELGKIIDATGPEVIIDFTVAKAVMASVRTAVDKKVNMVIGTTGLSTGDLDEINTLANKANVGIIVASNFALGAVLMMYLSKLAAKYMDYAEIIELHHNQKLDAPSGTAITTARGMVKTRGKPFLSAAGEPRGNQVESVTIHSVRLPGLMAHQEVIFGASGQTLSIRHDTINRECYVPGVALAVKDVIKRKGLVIGLDAIMGLQEVP